MTTARFLTYTASPLALVALFAALRNPALFLWYAALVWFAFGCGGIAAGVLMRDQRDRAREELARRGREAVPPPVARPYCLRCEVPIYQDEDGVWRREATGSQVCPRNPAVDGHEPVPTYDAPADLTARMVDVARAADRLRPDLRIVAPERSDSWLEEVMDEQARLGEGES
jgi:hypothetical protein